MDRFPRRRGSVRLVLELLEPREVPSTCVVNSLGDTGVGVAGDHGDLRFCVNRANALGGPDSITISVTGTIKLASGLPHLASDMSIIGPGADLLAVDAQYHDFPDAIFNVEPGATVALSGLTVTHGDPAFGPGGVRNYGTLVLKDSAVTNNYNFGSDDSHGGGIWNSGKMTIWGTTVSGNVCIGVIDCYGGGVYNSGSMQILDSTIAGNTVDAGWGAGVANKGLLDIRSSTVTANYLDCCYGSGLYAGGSTAIFDTIVAGNTGVADVYGPHTGSANLIGGNPRLGPLAWNGGHTQTHAILPGSPAIDSGDNHDAPEWDQRGPGFPRIVNGTIDIGAFEVQSTAGPAGGRSILATAPRPATATLDVPQPSPATAGNLRRPADRAPEPLPVATRQPAASVVHTVPVPPALDLDTADPF
jgi:hypothetical protein